MFSRVPEPPPRSCTGSAAVVLHSLLSDVLVLQAPRLQTCVMQGGLQAAAPEGACLNHSRAA